MLLFAGLAPLVVLATGVVADSPLVRDSLVTVPISKRIDSNGIPDLTKRDRGQTVNLPLDNTNFFYVVTIGVGEPATYYRLRLSSMTALTWVGMNGAYVMTNSRVNANISVDQPSMKSSLITGSIYNDTVTISEGVTISQQYIGSYGNPEKVTSTKDALLDGILGIGPNDLSLGVLSPDHNMIAPTITDTLFHQGKIQKNQVAVFFAPLILFPHVSGQLTFGGVDPTKYIGEISYFPLAKSSPANMYWSVDATFQYRNTTILNLNDAPGIFDTGSMKLYLAKEAYNQYVQATGAVKDDSTGFLSITPHQYERLESLYFKIGQCTYELNANAQIWPRDLNYILEGTGDLVYLIVSELGRDDLDGVGFIFGSRVLERFYVVFDSQNHRVGLANTKFTNSTAIN